jgi:thioredoxin-like negative regulator of GroEL
MTSPTFCMFLFLLAASLPLESDAFVATSSHRPALALDVASITKPLQMSDAASEWYTPPPPPPMQAKLPKHAVPIITHIDSQEAFQDYLQAPDDRITVVSFHAAWCKSCQKFGKLFQKLAKERADWAAGDANGDILETGVIRLASVEWVANTELCRSLGITVLPSVHYYQNGNKLAGFAAGPSKFQIVRDRLTYYQSLSKAALEFEASLETGGTHLSSDTIHLASDDEEQLSAK